MKRHIVHLSTYPADDIRVFQKACRTEVAEGYRVTEIVCDPYEGNVDGVEICSVKQAHTRLSRIIGLSWRMFRRANRHNADLYQIHHPDLIVAGLLLKARGKKVIYEPRECFPEKILSMHWIPRYLRRPVSRLFAWYERVTCLAWDHIIVADRYSAKEFARRPVTVVPNYPLLNSFDTPTTDKRAMRKLIYVGGLSQDRGLGVMLRIASLLQNHNVELDLLGQFATPEDEALLALRPNVRYLGKLDLRGVYSQLAQADLGLLLLQPVPAYSYAGENTLKLFEYMWCGLPVVASDFPNLRTIIEGASCGICLNPCDPDRAAGQIMRLLEEPRRRVAMGKNGRKAVVEAYNWPAASTLMNQAYSNVLNGLRCSVEPLPLWVRPKGEEAPQIVAL